MGNTGALATPIQLHPGLGRAAWDREATAWERHLRAEGKPDKTVTSYFHALNSLRRFLEAEELDQAPGSLTKDTAEAYMIHLGDQGRSRSTRVSYYTVLNLYWKYLVAEEAVEANPWERVGRPKLGEVHVPLATDEQVDALMASLTGRTFLDTRDRALLGLVLDAGLRRHEALGILLEDMDLRTRRALVWGKGDKSRLVTWGAATARDLDRYLRLRDRHPLAETVETVGREDHPRQGRPLFLGEARTGHGALSGAGFGVMLARRCAQAGVDRLHPHQLRHTWAHDGKLGGMRDDELMALGGWSSPAMLARYGRAERQSRALANYQSPQDRRARRK